MTTFPRRARTSERARTAQRRRSLSTTVLATAALGLAATACAPFAGEAQPTETATATVTSTPQAAPAGTPAAEPNELRYVSSTAAPCASVWVAGAVLPTNYEWCVGEDGVPVSGVRIGSCEVIAYRNEMYAVPGRAIQAGAGALQLDPQFLASLTSCKRRPAPTGRLASTTD